MRKHLRYLASLLTLLMVFTLALSPLSGRADFGDFSSDSDWGSDSSWDSGSDWGSSWDSDWSSSSSSSSSSRRSGSGNGNVTTLELLFGIFYIGFWIYVFIKAYTNRNKNQEHHSGSSYGSCGTPEGAARARALARGESTVKFQVPDMVTSAARARTLANSSGDTGSPAKARAEWDFELRSMATLDQECYTPTFTALYRRMQDAWGAGDITCLEADFTPDAFAQYKRQLEEKNTRDEHAHCIVHSVIADRMGWNETQTEWRLAVRIVAVITAWDTDGQGNIISGSDTQRKQMIYAWELRKSKYAGANVRKCPNCGASLQINAGIKCPHCETQLTAAANRWTLHSIKGVSQKTLD